MDDISLLVHITSGAVAFMVAVLAISLKKGTTFHRRLGRAYFCAMSLVFISALHLSFIAVPINWFLFGISIFSYYLAFTGFRAGRERENLPTTMDWIAAWIMLAGTVFMVLLSSQLLWNQNNLGLVLITFGGIGGALAIQDILQFRKGKILGKFLNYSHYPTLAVQIAFCIECCHTTAGCCCYCLSVAVIRHIASSKYPFNAGRRSIAGNTTSDY